MSQKKLRVIFIIFTVLLIGIFTAGTYIFWGPMIPFEHRMIIVGVVSVVLIFISFIFYLFTNTVRKNVMEPVEHPSVEVEEVPTEDHEVK